MKQYLFIPTPWQPIQGHLYIRKGADMTEVQAADLQAKWKRQGDSDSGIGTLGPQ
jgi:hypothetical protein